MKLHADPDEGYVLPRRISDHITRTLVNSKALTSKVSLKSGQDSTSTCSPEKGYEGQKFEFRFHESERQSGEDNLTHGSRKISNYRRCKETTYADY